MYCDDCIWTRKINKLSIVQNMMMIYKYNTYTNKLTRIIIVRSAKKQVF